MGLIHQRQPIPNPSHPSKGCLSAERLGLVIRVWVNIDPYFLLPKLRTVRSIIKVVVLSKQDAGNKVFRTRKCLH